MKTDSFRIENFDMYILQHENEGKDYVRIEFERDMGRSRSYICVPRSELSKPAKLYDALIDAGAHLEFKKSQTNIFVQLLTKKTQGNTWTTLQYNRLEKSGRQTSIPTGKQANH